MQGVRYEAAGAERLLHPNDVRRRRSTSAKGAGGGRAMGPARLCTCVGSGRALVTGGVRKNGQQLRGVAQRHVARCAS